MVDLSGLQRLGAGLSAGIDLVSPFIGGSGSLVKSLATSSAKQAAKQAGKQAAKSGAKEFVKHLAKEAMEEAGEEALQNLAEELNEQGGWDEGTLGRTAEAAAMGALGSGLMTGAGTAISAGKAKLNQQGGLRGLIGEARSNMQNGNNIATKVDNAYSNIVNKGAVERLAKGIEQGADGNIKFVRMDKNVFADINNVRAAQGLEPLTKRQVTAYRNAINNNLNNRVNEGMDARTVAEIAYDSLTNSNAEALPGKFNNTVMVSPYNEGKYAGSVLGKAQDGGTSLKSIEPRATSQVEGLQATKNDLLSGQKSGSPLTANQEGSVTQSRTADPVDSSTSLGFQRPESPATPLGVLDSSISQNGIDVNTRPQLDALYKQYSSDFYDKMPDSLKTSYETMLDNAPRDKNGVYTDPITGEKWVDEVIRGGAPDGSNLVRTDYNLPENSSIANVSRAIKQAIQERFQGNSYKIGETDNLASITAKSREELGFKQRNMSNADFVKKGSMVGNLDELIENMSDVREVPNRKPEQKPNVDHYLSGRVAVDLGDGETYYPRIDIEVSRSGNIIGYNIADIKRFPLVNSTNPHSRATNSRVDNGGTSRTPNIAQDSTNVNKNLSSLVVDEGGEVTDRRTLSQETLRTQLGEREELKAYYKKYGDDFYEKLPEDLRDRYEEMLESTPRSEDGVFLIGCLITVLSLLTSHFLGSLKYISW